MKDRPDHENAENRLIRINSWTSLKAGMSRRESAISRFLIKPKSNASPLLQGFVILGPVIDFVMFHEAPFLL